MLSIGGRASGLTSRAVAQCVGGRALAALPANPVLSDFEEKEHILPGVVPYEFQLFNIHPKTAPSPPTATSASLSKTLLTRGLSVGAGIGVGHSVRYIHNDLKIPDFDSYRRDSTKNPNKSAQETKDQRRLAVDMCKVGVGVTTVIAAKKIAHTFVANLSPAASTLALGVIEVDLSKIPEGKNVTIKWNNKPVFVRHRVAEEIARERAQDIKELRDPQTDEERSFADPSGKWLVVMANCTHLGCVPIANQGNWGGYYCPCHGSHYDASGRIRKGPAPLNLEVPDHHIKEEQNILILGAKAPV